MNGIGSFATTVFSKRFIGTTDDGKNKMIAKFKNNSETCDVVVLPPGSNPGTSVSFFPDLARFGMEIIDDLHKSLIHQRVLNLSVLYPQIRFKFNKRVVKIDARKFMSMFSDTFEYIEEDDYLIGIFPNEAADFSYHTYVNSLWLEKGGNHISFLTGKIVDELRSKLIRRYKSIKPGDIKNKISTLVFFRNFPNAKFDGQPKEFLTNTQKEITSFLNFNDAQNKKDWEKFTNKLYKNKNIIEPITDLYNAKMLIEEKKRLKEATKKQDVPEKYWPATKVNKYLFTAEGDSAIDAIISEISRDECGFFPLKGVPLNVIKDRSKVTKNAEIKQIASILGIDLTTNTNVNLEYENIVIATDADVDGAHITGILLGLFQMYVPKYLEEGRVFQLMTPLVTILDKKGQYKFMFNIEDYEEFRKKYDPKGTKFIYDYKKGLGSMEEDEWAALFQQYKVEDLLRPLHLKDSPNPEEEIHELNNWLSDNVDFRKSKILEKIKEFDINKV
jgi:DNA topoisomerase-2